MKHLFSEWGTVAPLLKSRPVFLFLDFDGTLAPIVSRPSLARMDDEIRKWVRDLLTVKNIRIAVVSGRSLADVKKKVGVRGLIYAGNHGLELEGPGIRRVHPSATAFRHLAGKLTFRLRKFFAFMPNVLVEGKTFTVSIHYRNIPEDKEKFLKMILLKEIGVYLGRSLVSLYEGKKVWEIRPPTEWNKGKTALWLMARVCAHTGKPFFPVYAGDDVTDEDAFKALKRRGLTIRVTDEESTATAADYFVWSPAEVLKFLKRLHLLKKSSGEETHAR